jgi:hypothetical protein
MMLSKKATLVLFAVLLGLPTPLLADKLDSSADSFFAALSSHSES